MAQPSSTTAKAQKLDAVLRALFRALEARPTPEVFRILIEQFDDARPPDAGQWSDCASGAG